MIFVVFMIFGRSLSSGALEALASRQRRKSMRNERNSTQNTVQSAPQPQNTPSNVPEPSRIDWSGQTGRKSKKHGNHENHEKSWIFLEFSSFFMIFEIWRP